MKKFEYLVRFTTPAFLGNAEQSGQWRTPPFKALLRQWWRVAWAAGNRFPTGDAAVERMRREEGLLFGHAWLEDDTFERNGRQVTTAARKSLVRLRLDRWDAGQLQKSQWPKDMTVIHREVKDKKTAKPRPIGSSLYLGYGPLEFNGGTALKKNTAIQAGESATFTIAFPTTHKSPELKALVEANAPRLERALWLMDRYGTLGGRSRNGWGSFVLEPAGDTPDLPTELGAELVRPWCDCLDRDWPHAIGEDEQGTLAWQTEAFDDWKATMRRLAEIKIGLRTQFSFPNERPDGEVHQRHWLSYPVTKHNVRAWDRNKLRLPNSLRFKVRALQGGKLIGVIFHVPCLPPPSFNPNYAEIERVWQQGHAFLDAPAQKLTRIPA